MVGLQTGAVEPPIAHVRIRQKYGMLSANTTHIAQRLKEGRWHFCERLAPKVLAIAYVWHAYYSIIVYHFLYDCIT